MNANGGPVVPRGSIWLVSLIRILYTCFAELRLGLCFNGNILHFISLDLHYTIYWETTHFTTHFSSNLSKKSMD
jgi:hypothetical protein